jgi:hypothetical protein
MRTRDSAVSRVSSLNDSRPHYETESARMSSAAETRFRLAEQRPTGRVVKVIALDRVTERDLTDAAAADLVVMVTAAGHDARAAATIGGICSERRITTATLVVRGPSATDEMLSNSLAQVRPWSLMVVIAGHESYLDDLLTSFR